MLIFVCKQDGHACPYGSCIMYIMINMQASPSVIDGRICVNTQDLKLHPIGCVCLTWLACLADQLLHCGSLPTSYGCMPLTRVTRLHSVPPAQPPQCTACVPNLRQGFGPQPAWHLNCCWRHQHSAGLLPAAAAAAPAAAPAGPHPPHSLQLPPPPPQLHEQQQQLNQFGWHLTSVHLALILP